MKFGIDRLLAEPKLRKPLAGKSIALLAHPGIGDARPDAFARRARGARRHRAHRGLRPAARPARRQAGQHDRVAGLHRPGARHPGVQPVRRGAPADRGDDGQLRRAAGRSAGPRLPHLHVHHDAALRARSSGAARQGGVGARPAESGRPARRRLATCAPAGRASSAPVRCRCATASRSASWRAGSCARCASTSTVE